MKTYIDPDKEQWKEILKRPLFDVSELHDKVSSIMEDIRQTGDEALLDYTEKFDGVRLERLRVTEAEMQDAAMQTDSKLKAAIQLASDNIQAFHEVQRIDEKKIQTSSGVYCWQKSVAIEKVGLYIPGGSAPLFSTVLMLALPARIAGCKEIVLCSPPGKDGKIHPAILYAAGISGVTQIYKLGGVQAIAAMAVGTRTVPAVHKIFGPGNQYVMAAKQLASMKDVAIDMPAGPSEVLVVADLNANSAFVAADLLSQAEHGPDSQVILLTDTEEVIRKVEAEIAKQLAVLPRKELAQKALTHSIAIVLPEKDQQIDLINAYAPEHLILNTIDYNEFAKNISNAGSVFLGSLTPESAGDYASGTNHTLLTNGWARAYSGVNLDSFVKKITFQEITREGLQNIGPAIETMAAAEELTAHKNAVSLRLSSLNKQNT